jgi:aryl-alcohol dehydrogenase-like predicted oxidoreductase
MPGMEYRSLGRTGVKVSKLCLGCMNLGTLVSEEESARIIDKALDEGINFLDTANVYGRGKSEKAVGEALKRNGKRDKVVLATKVCSTMADGDPNANGCSRRHIIQQCEESLRRLQTDYIDLYQLHFPIADIPIDEALRALDDLIRAGKVRYIGTSKFKAWELMESLWVSKELGLNRFISEQPPYNLLDRRIEDEVIPMAKTYGMAIIPFSPLAGGFLTGKYKRGEQPPSGARYSTSTRYSDIIDQSRAHDVVDVVLDIAKERGCTPSQVATAWVAQQDGITAPIIGPKSIENLQESLGALKITLSPEELERLDQVSPPKRGVYTFADPNIKMHYYRW